MAKEKWISVPREAFLKFVSEYRPKLVYDVCGIFDPPIGSYNDFSGGKAWPDSVVCYISLGGMSHVDNPYEYFILRGLTNEDGYLAS